MATTYNTKHPVTVQEMDRVSNSIGLSHYNDSAMTKVCLIVRLGFDVTAETYERELHAVERATELEARPLSEQVAEEVENDTAWLNYASERNDEYNIPLDLIERHNAKVKADIFTRDPDCKHEKAFPIHGGMMCRCGAKFEARNEFEQRLVNARNPKGNGYVNWQFR